VNQEVARQITSTMHDIASRLDESVLLVQERSPSDLGNYRRAVGQVLGEMWDGILWPLYQQHPELRPDELKDGDSQ